MTIEIPRFFTDHPLSRKVLRSLSKLLLVSMEVKYCIDDMQVRDLFDDERLHDSEIRFT